MECYQQGYLCTVRLLRFLKFGCIGCLYTLYMLIDTPQLFTIQASVSAYFPACRLFSFFRPCQDSKCKNLPSRVAILLEIFPLQQKIRDILEIISPRNQPLIDFLFDRARNLFLFSAGDLKKWISPNHPPSITREQHAPLLAYDPHH